MRAAFVAAGAALALTISGCSSDVPGAPTPVSAPASSQPNGGKSAAVARNPCQALSDAQVRPVTGQIRARDRLGTGNSTGCNLFPEDYRKPRVTVMVFPAITDPQQLEQAKATATVWRSTRVGGYAAAQASNLTNGPARGDCRTLVSIPGSAAVGVQVQTETPSAPHYHDMCTVSDQLVGKLVR